MKIGQLNKQIRRIIRPGRKYLITITVDDVEGKKKTMAKMECIGAYAHIATFREVNSPYLTYSFDWFDLHSMMAKKEMLRAKEKKSA